MKTYFLYLMALFYIGAGINHFLNSDIYVSIMPAFLPWHLAIVYISGVLEIVFGILLLIPKTRSTAAWSIVVLLIFIFPANIQMMLNYAQQNNPDFWITLLRLPLQFLLIWWAILYTRRNIDNK